MKPILRFFLGITITLIPCLLRSQTIAMEEQNLNRKIKSMSSEKIVSLVNSWRTFLVDYGEFPKLPFDSSSNQINYSFVDNYSLSKSVIFNRVLEWGALSFGSLDAVLHYKDFESGKIIIKGYFSINYKEDYQNFWGKTKEQLNSKDVFQTYIFTIKDNKLKVQIEGIEVEFAISGYSNSNFYVPASKRKYPLDALYPITDQDPIRWKEHLNILKEINDHIAISHRNMKRYISGYQQDYAF